LDASGHRTLASTLILRALALGQGKKKKREKGKGVFVSVSMPRFVFFPPVKRERKKRGRTHWKLIQGKSPQGLDLSQQQKK